MRSKIISLMIVATALFAGSAAFADEVVIHHNRSDAIVPVPPPGDRAVVVEHRSGDCQTTTVHKENDAGDSKTVRKTDCD